MLITLKLPSMPIRLQPSKVKALSNHSLSVAVVPDLGSLSNTIRLAQYRRKKAIQSVNTKASFPLEVYEM